MRFQTTQGNGETDPVQNAQTAMDQIDQSHPGGDSGDGSNRCLAYCRACKRHGFDVAATIELVNERQQFKPPKKDWTAAQIERRWNDAKVECGEAYDGDQPKWQRNVTTIKTQANGKQPPTEDDLAAMLDDAAGVCRSVVTGILNGEADKLFDCGPAFPMIEVGPGLLALIGAPPGRGKSSLAMQLTYAAIANEPGLPVIVASLEMTPAVLIKRHLAGLIGVSYDNIRFNTLTDYQRQELTEAAKTFIDRLEGVKFLKQEFCGLGDLDRLRQAADKPGILVLDYLQLFGPPDDDAKARIGKTMTLATSYCDDGWAVICVSAVNRAGYETGGLAALRDSSGAEYGGSAMYLLNEVENPADPDRRDPIKWLQLECKKNRHGPQRSYDLYFNGPQMLFSPRGPVNECEGAFDAYNNGEDPANAFSERKF